MATVSNKTFENKVQVNNLDTAIARISRQFKLDCIKEYDDVYRQIHGERISIEIFDSLLEETCARIEYKTSIMYNDEMISSQITRKIS